MNQPTKPVNTKKISTINNQVCAVCGYRHLASPQRSASGGASHEICPSCGFESGHSDDVEGKTFEQWRADWVTKGLAWSSKGMAKPNDWNPMRDLHALLRRKRPVISQRVLAQVAAARGETHSSSEPATNSLSKEENAPPKDRKAS
jgi:hypothetical protein